jgi:histidinol-phosphatase
MAQNDTTSNLVNDLDKCLRLADVADEITMGHFRSVALDVQTKPDRTPVTEADLAVDKALHDIVVDEYGDAYLSEEGDQTHHKGRQWIVDPIDGTKNFMRRHPVWGALISLQDESGTLAAVVSAPALGRRWWASQGKGAWTRDVDGTVRQIHVSQVGNLRDAYLTYCSLLPWDDTPVGVEGIVNLMRASWRERSFGDFLGHVFVAEGVVDACMEPNTKEWDMAAHIFIVQEAGGSTFTDANADTPASKERFVMTSNIRLHDKLRKALKQ